MRYIVVHDTTLREGDQTPGVVMDYDKKVRIAEMLLDLGVDEVEAGFPAASGIDYRVVKYLAESFDPSRIVGFGRAVGRDIDLVAETGCRKINIFAPSSTKQLKYLMPGKTLEYVEEMLGKATEYARSLGLEVEVSLMDATRSDNLWIGRLSRKAAEGGAYRVVIADTVGCATPKIIRDKVKAVRDHANVGVGVHLHNDVGLATGNAIVAIESGVDEIQTTVGGVGERVGNTPLEELAAVQLVDGSFKTGLVLDRVVPTVRSILELIGFRVSPGKPVVGDNSFAHTTDLHIRSVLQDPESFEAFDPKLLGGERKILVTHLIGKRSLELLLKELGLEVSGVSIDDLLDRVKEYVFSSGKPLSIEEFKSLVKELTGEKA